MEPRIVLPSYHSCFAVAFDTEPFYRSKDPLIFRGIPDSLADYGFEASERCLVHADNPLTNKTYWINPQVSSKRGVWINPNVRIGQSNVENRVGQWFLRARSLTMLQVMGIWWNRLLGWTTFTFYGDLVIKRTVEDWNRRYPRLGESALHCLVR